MRDTCTKEGIIAYPELARVRRLIFMPESPYISAAYVLIMITTLILVRHYANLLVESYVIRTNLKSTFKK